MARFPALEKKKDITESPLMIPKLGSKTFQEIRGKAYGDMDK